MRRLIRFLTLCAVIMLLPGLICGAEPEGQRIRETIATVTFVRGTPMLVEGASMPRPLIKGQTLGAGDAVQTDGVSRIELVLSSGGTVRLAEDAVLELESNDPDTPDSRGQLQMRLVAGDMWVNYSGENRSNPPRILGAGALVSGPQSIFRGIIYGGGGMEVKVYSGQVTARGPFETREEGGNGSPESESPGEDEGSSPEPWQYQVTPYRKMLVLASGKASQPFRFSAKSDFTDWVRWNQERDEAVK